MNRRDPKPRRGGLCARKGCKKNASLGIRTADGMITNDPFCSTQCAKVYFGVITEEERASAAEHAARSRYHQRSK